MNEEILKYCLGKGMLIDKETYQILENFDYESIKKIIGRISGLREKMITKSFIINNAEKIREMVDDETLVEKIKINFGMSLEIEKEKKIAREEKTERMLGNIKVVYSPVNQVKKISVIDFVRHFRNRHNELKQFLMERKELENLTSINKITGNRQNVSIIASVFSRRISKNKNLILEVEDATGQICVIVNKDKAEVFNKSKDILTDEVIGIRGAGDRNRIYANDIFYPDSFFPDKTYFEKDEMVAFISDIHVGSKNFLEKSFLKFIAWLNGEVGDEKQREEAKKVRYLFITGDCVDGVGVFPEQSELLNIQDVKEQYKKLAFYLGKIRKNVSIIMCPGQHDAVRVAEPQPAIGKEYGEALYSLDNLILISNPSLVEITNNGKKGIKILMYHGASMTSFVSEIEHLRISKAHERPSKVVKEMLKRRHLAPIHSSVTYIPNEKEDPMVIKEVPDIITTADFHRPDVDVYNNVLIICSSCWQSITLFEEKVGNVPEPCKVPILNLKTREIKIMDFST